LNIIVNHKRTTVMHDPNKKIYIKEFHPKFSFRLKYLLHFRKYPGNNFKYIAEKLNYIDIKTPRIIEASNYKVVTEEIEGELLRDYLKKDKTIIKSYLDLIVKVLENNIYFGDFNTGNFIVKSGKIYALDLEDYRKEILFLKGRKESLLRLKKTLNNDEWYEYVERKLETNPPLKKVAFSRLAGSFQSYINF